MDISTSSQSPPRLRHSCSALQRPCRSGTETTPLNARPIPQVFHHPFASMAEHPACVGGHRRAIAACAPESFGSTAARVACILLQRSRIGRRAVFRLRANFRIHRVAEYTEKFIGRLVSFLICMKWNLLQEGVNANKRSTEKKGEQHL